MTLKYEYRREPRNDAVGKGHMVVAIDTHGIENVILFSPSVGRIYIELKLLLELNHIANLPPNPDAATGKDGSDTKGSE